MGYSSEFPDVGYFMREQGTGNRNGGVPFKVFSFGEAAIVAATVAATISRHAIFCGGRLRHEACPSGPPLRHVLRCSIRGRRDSTVSTLSCSNIARFYDQCKIKGIGQADHDMLHYTRNLRNYFSPAGVVALQAVASAGERQFSLKTEKARMMLAWLPDQKSLFAKSANRGG